MTAKPMNAATTLNTSATVPRAVNPSGNLAGGTVAPLRFKRSSVLPAALPAVAMFWDLQTCRWSSGILRLACNSSGASIMVAVRPLATCHSMWQWKSQMRERSERSANGEELILKLEREERWTHIWIVCAEAKDHVTIWSHHDGISSHRDFRERLIVSVESRFFIRTDNGLESMSVQVEGMFAGIIVVEDNLDNLVLFENISVNIGPIDGGIGGRGTSSKSSEKSWDFGLYVGNTIEKCA